MSSLVMLGVILIALCAAFFPGHMSGDSFSMYGQALEGKYSDWHPPVLSASWRLLLHIFGAVGPAPILVLNIFVSAFAIYLFLYAILNGKYRAFLSPFLTALILLFPPILGWLGVASKDIAFGASLLLASAILVDRVLKTLSWNLLRRWPGEILLWSSFAWALAARYNGLPAIIPLVLLRLFSDEKFPQLTFRRLILTILTSIVLSVGLLLSVQVATERILQPTKEFASQQVMLFDLAGLTLRSGEFLLPQSTFPSRNIEALRHLYWPESVNPLFWGEGNVERIQLTKDANTASKIKQCWISAIIQHPKEYLMNRWDMFRGLLGESAFTHDVCAPFHYGIDPNQLEVTLRFPNLNAYLMQYLDTVKNYVTNRLWLYVGLLALVCIIIAFAPRSRAQYLLLIPLSGLGYILSYFFLAPICDLRYGWYSIAISILSIPLSIRVIFTGSRAKRS